MPVVDMSRYAAPCTIHYEAERYAVLTALIAELASNRKSRQEFLQKAS